MRPTFLIACLLCLATGRGLAQSSAATGLPPGVHNTQNPADKPLPPLEALKKMTLPAGFNATLFAGEPDLMQPIAFTFDDRGRLWVVECFSYPNWDTPDCDRVVIYTDKDGDGKFDEKKVFWNKGHRLTGIEVGFGGVWLCSSPNLLFIPDANGDDVPDSEPRVVLDGWTLKAGHNSFNGLAWGPDGWLYGRHGITAPSLVGAPGTPDSNRTKLDCSIWRYHPVRHTFEVVTHGTTNPWGLDWDDYGQAFFSNNVIGHLWHMIPGAHYKRMFGQDFNPYVYQLMDMTADHLHWAAADWTKSRTGQEEYGGGHSHAGAMIYLGDNWPDRYRSSIFMSNIHGNRVLYDNLERSGSGYVAHHGGNFLLANDPWFRGVTVSYGPDGGVFVSDWNDLGECHDHDGVYRTSGRIYKITYGKTSPLRDLNLAEWNDDALVRLQLHKNDWFVRHARRLLEERAVAHRLSAGTAPALRSILNDNPDVTRKLRALWALYSIGEMSNDSLINLLDHENENMRWWAIQLLGDTGQVPASAVRKFATMATADHSPLVRLALASVMQKLPAADRWEIAEGLVAHEEDAADKNLPLMIWYGIEPSIPLDRQRALVLITKCRFPEVRQFIARRVAVQ